MTLLLGKDRETEKTIEIFTRELTELGLNLEFTTYLKISIHVNFVIKIIQTSFTPTEKEPVKRLRQRQLLGKWLKDCSISHFLTPTI